MSSSCFCAFSRNSKISVSVCPYFLESLNNISSLSSIISSSFGSTSSEYKKLFNSLAQSVILYAISAMLSETLLSVSSKADALISEFDVVLSISATPEKLSLPLIISTALFTSARSCSAFCNTFFRFSSSSHSPIFIPASSISLI